jgi:hypothetical protein
MFGCFTQKSARPRLPVLRLPVGRIVPVEVKTPPSRIWTAGIARYGAAVIERLDLAPGRPPLDRSFRVDPVESANAVFGPAPHHQARILLGDFPLALRMGNAHRQDLPVAIDILRAQPFGLFRFGVHERAGAEQLRVVKVPVGAVHGDPGQHIDGPGIQQFGHGRVRPVLAQQIVNGVDSHGSGGHLAGVMLPVDVVGGLHPVLAGGEVGQRHLPDYAPFGARAQGLQAAEARV